MSLLSEHYDNYATKRDLWYKSNSYYHKDLAGYFRFLIPPKSRILELGCSTGHLLGQLDPSYGVGVDVSPKTIELARIRYPQLKFFCSEVEDFTIDETYDYIILSGTLGSVANIQQLLIRIKKFCTSDTRLIITSYNNLWCPVLIGAEKTGIKIPEIVNNWLSIDDIVNFCDVSGYQVIRRDRRLLLPFYIPLLSFLINKFLARLPLLRRLTLTHCLVARPYIQPTGIDEQKVSVILTCRDEEDNIEGLVKGIPEMGRHTEIVFVEGHSTDGTVARINEMIGKYPQKDIKLYTQKGKGQGDAFRLGCEKAEGDFLCWLEADLTIPPDEIGLFWDAYRSGKGEYCNGTRFVYQMEKDAMPFFNYVGNRFFGRIFSMIFKQRFTDTLCGFKCISKRNYERIRREIGFFGDFDPFGDFELIFGVIKNSLKVVEIPVHYRPRIYGQPKAYGKGFFSFLNHALMLMRMSWIAFRKFLFF